MSNTTTPTAVLPTPIPEKKYGVSFKHIEDALGYELPHEIAMANDAKRDEKINTLLLCAVLKELKTWNTKK